MGKYAGNMPGGAQRIPGYRIFVGTVERFNLMTKVKQKTKNLPPKVREAIHVSVLEMLKEGSKLEDLLTQTDKAVQTFTR